MPLKKVYRTGGKSYLASADFYDIVTNTTYKTFYLADLQTGNDATSYVLTTQTPFSTNGYSVVVNNTVEKNFDATFTIPLIIEGDMTFTVPAKMAGANPMTGVWTLQVYRVRNATEEAVGSKITWTRTDASADYVFSGSVTLPRTSFKKDDILRVELTITSDTAGESVYMFYDPQNRTTVSGIATTRSQASINLPVRIPE